MPVDFGSEFASENTRWSGLLRDSTAGLLTAFVFYAEYASLGSYLGQQWPGSAGAARGALAVLSSVVMAALLSIAQKRPVLSGPRAASLAVLVGGIAAAIESNPDPIRAEDVATVALACMLSIAGLMQCLGRARWVRTGIHALPIPVRKGFMFATAIAIVSGLASRQLNACLTLNPVATVTITAASLAVYFLWTGWCEQPTAGRRLLTPLGIPTAAITATMGYYATMAASSRGEDRCGTLGARGMDWSSVITMPKILDGAVARAHLAPTTVSLMVGFGLTLGIVMLLESLTTLTDSEANVPSSDWSRMLTLSGAANLICAVLGFSCQSLSTSRTNSLVEANGRTSVAVLVHGIALLAISVLLVEWIGKLPQLTIAVVLVIVATQMIDRVTRQDVWSGGFAPLASQAATLRTWYFIAFVFAAVLTGLLSAAHQKPFGAGTVIALICVILFQAIHWSLWRQRRHGS